MTTGKAPVGFIGLGLMGFPMMERLLSAGHCVTVWNRSPEKIARAVSAGAKAAETPADVARFADVVLICVTDDPAVNEIVFGTNGLATSATNQKVLVDCSTIRPVACRQMAERLRRETGMAWIDAPVTGGVVGARAGKLVIMAGGTEDDIERVRPIMAAVSQSFKRMGPQGAGLVTKLCNQVIVACGKVVLSEMLLLARDGGVDGATIPEALRNGSADSTQLQREAPRMVARDFDHPHGTASTILKDLDIIGEFARDVGGTMPVTELVHELFRAHIAAGNGGRDSVSIFEAVEQRWTGEIQGK
jgi:3-hydroxyisobutyrate dehydrogenase